MYPPPKHYKPNTRKVSQEDQKWLKYELQQHGQFTGLGWILSKEPEGTKLPIKTVEEIILSKEFVNGNFQVENLLEQMKLTEEQQCAVQKATIGQRENPSWQLLRKGRLTASNFGVILKSKRATPSLMKRLSAEYDLSGVQSINWGVVNEAEGIKAFTKATGLTVTDSGFWLTSSGILGASPDGRVGENAIIEVKFPYTQRNTQRNN